MRVPYAGEDAWIGERALQGAVFAPQGSRECLRGCLQRLDSPGVVLVQGRFSPDDVQRRPLVAAGLGEEQAAAGEIEGRVAPLSGDHRAAVPPLKAPCDHEVYDDEEVVLQPHYDALAEA